MTDTDLPPGATWCPASSGDYHILNDGPCLRCDLASVRESVLEIEDRLALLQPPRTSLDPGKVYLLTWTLPANVCEAERDMTVKVTDDLISAMRRDGIKAIGVILAHGHEVQVVSPTVTEARALLDAAEGKTPLGDSAWDALRGRT